MTDEHRPIHDAPLGEQEGEDTELTGQPMDPQSTPHRATPAHDDHAAEETGDSPQPSRDDSPAGQPGA